MLIREIRAKQIMRWGFRARITRMNTDSSLLSVLGLKKIIAKILEIIAIIFGIIAIIYFKSKTIVVEGWNYKPIKPVESE